MQNNNYKISFFIVIINLVLLSSLTAFGFDLSVNWNWNISQDTSYKSFFGAAFFISLNDSKNTDFGISLEYLNIETATETGFIGFSSYGKYYTETSFGTFSIYGKGGGIFPLNFDFSSTGYLVSAGARYYVTNFFIGFNYSVLYLYNDIKLDIIPIEIGIHF
ncbi:hypothetical protein JYK00_04925 [Thermosipho ferrireducens]|uniref:Outer membrane protein beta-barrel domain-containing protein n=1 Tax=Thermosipho ferrireducens TaxID=2571116 RepID=A0ABX7S5N3_9BACT|nr:hypothetical protein [Thermosipho ferrireducens]QTA37101.1 hypothetical protein JYK00_04925 [Thermosipho ferrireducens]